MILPYAQEAVLRLRQICAGKRYDPERPGNAFKFFESEAS